MDQLQRQLEELKRKHEDVIKKRNAELEVIKELSVAPEENQSNTATIVSATSKTINLTMEEPKEKVELAPVQVPHFARSTQSDFVAISTSDDHQSEQKENIILEVDDGATLSFDIQNDVEDVVTTQFSSTTSDFSSVWSEKYEARHFPTDCAWRGRNFITSYKTNQKNQKGYVILRDVAKLGPSTKFECSSQPTCVTYVPNSSDLFLVGGTTGLLYLYDTRAQENPVAQTQRWNKCHTAQVIGEVFLADRRFVSLAADGSVYLWDLDELAKPLDVELHMSQYSSQGSRPTAVTITDLGNLLVGFEDGSVISKSTKNKDLDERLDSFGGPITGIDFRPGFKGQRSAYCVSSLDGVVGAWTSERCVRRVESLTESYVGCCWRPGPRQQFAAMRSDGAVSLIDAEGEGEEHSLGLDAIATCARFSGDGKHLCVGCINETVHIINCPTQAEQ